MVQVTDSAVAAAAAAANRSTGIVADRIGDGGNGPRDTLQQRLEGNEIGFMDSRERVATSVDLRRKSQ